MKAISFPQSNIIMGKNQPEYLPIPAHRPPDGGSVTMCYEVEPSDFPEGLRAAVREIALVQDLPKVYITLLTFGSPMQPICVQSKFDPPPTQMKGEVVATPAIKEAPPALPPASKLKLADIAEVRGLSGGFLWGMDTESKPGKAICHFVRLETMEFDNGPEFDKSSFSVVHPDSDKRLAHLAECFTGELEIAKAELAKCLVQIVSVCKTVNEVCRLPQRIAQSFDIVAKTAAVILQRYGS